MRITLCKAAACAAIVVAAATAFAEEITFDFPLTGLEEVPPVETPGSGMAHVTYDTETNELSWLITYQDLLGTQTAAHFHGPAEPGQNAGPQVNIGTGNPLIGSTTITQTQEAQLLSGLWYVNIHSTAHSGGEIRGQVVQQATAPKVLINEIRIDQPSLDDDEYIELLVLEEIADLKGLTLLVIGDGAGAQGSGVIEAVVDLSSIGGQPVVLIAEETFKLAPIEQVDLVTNLNFENSDNVTFLIVTGFTGALGDDLDTDDDCELDDEPWDAVADMVALIEEPNPPTSTECAYGKVMVGPDGSFVPGHAYRCSDTGEWAIGAFDIVDGDDTPGAFNPACAQPDCPADLDGSGSVGVPDLLDLLANWGECGDCPADLDGSGSVGVPDLLELLAQWGDCPQ